MNDCAIRAMSTVFSIRWECLALEGDTSSTIFVNGVKWKGSWGREATS
jgi:hypothetical protein